MRSDKRGFLVVSIIAAAAGLGFMLMWPEESRPLATAPIEEHKVALTTLQGFTRRPQESLPEDQEEGPNPMRHPTPVSATESDVATERLLSPEDGTVEALLEMLDDPAFLVACAQPSDADGEVLSFLVIEARDTYAAFRAAEAERRLQAGLGERQEGYRPGEPFETQPPKRGDESVTYHFDGSNAYRIVFPFNEYPAMYALRDQIYLLEGELKRRER